MLGAIIGDLAGSVYEYSQFQKFSPVCPKNIIEKDAFFSDDSILTIAILDAILSGESYEKKLKEYATKYQNYRPNVKAYFQNSFSPSFIKWAKGDYVGTSIGNGALMRVSSVGYLFDSEKEVLENARLATIPSHNSEEGIFGAQMVSLAIFYARKGLSKEQIFEKLPIKIQKPNLTKFNYTCNETLDVCFYSLYAENDFASCIKKAISFGGDTDTNACVVGSVAEAMYGIDEKTKALALSKIPQEFATKLKEGYSKITDLTNSIDL